jgi:ribosomal protein S18 acetylase RimI-like enzyme
VLRLLQSDIPTRVQKFGCLVWIYYDPNGQAVGFGTLELSNKEYPQFTGGKQHFYIPLLAVHPAFGRRGYGKEIVRHLTTEAAKVVALMALCAPGISDLLFLDVYVKNTAAVGLYLGQQFVTLNPNNPEVDPKENGEEYFVMARNLAIAPSP